MNVSSDVELNHVRQYRALAGVLRVTEQSDLMVGVSSRLCQHKNSRLVPPGLRAHARLRRRHKLPGSTCPGSSLCRADNNTVAGTGSFPTIFWQGIMPLVQRDLVPAAFCSIRSAAPQQPITVAKPPVKIYEHRFNRERNTARLLLFLAASSSNMISSRQHCASQKGWSSNFMPLGLS